MKQLEKSGHEVAGELPHALHVALGFGNIELTGLRKKRGTMGDMIYRHAFALTNQPFDRLGDVRHKTDERADIDQVEDRMECGHVQRNVGRIQGIARHDDIDQIDEWLEEEHRPDYAEDIEDKVSECRAFRVGIATHGRDICGDGGADVFSENNGAGTGVIDPALIGHGEGDGTRDRGGLHDDGEDRAEGEEEEHGEDASIRVVLHKLEDFRALTDIRHGILQEHQAKKQNAESHDELARVFELGATREDQRQSKADERQGDRRHTELEAEKGNDPEGGRCAEIGPHDHADRFGDGEETRVDETHNHHGRGRGGLHEASDTQPGAESHEPIARHGAHHPAQFFA